MVELLPGYPDFVAAYRAKDSVNRQEYEEVVMKRVNDVAQKYGVINFLVLLETNFENYDFDTFLQYLKISFKHFNRWNRMAIVTNENWVRRAYDALSPLVHGEIRGYHLEELDQARQWVSESIADHDSLAPFKAGIIGTVAMTSFSYLASNATNSNFKEPQILGRFSKNGLPALSEKQAELAGWMEHYAVGCSWALIYDYLLRKKWIAPGGRSGLKLGLFSGLVAIAAWRILFKLNQGQSKAKQKSFYLQLIPAHVVFSIVSILALNERSRQS